METLCHSDNAFVTLTYAEDTIPHGGSLVPAHLSEFVKRLRDRVSPVKIRYYGVGEYGDQTQRPHYHAILFGYATCLAGRSRYGERRSSCCSQCDRVREAWGFGNVWLGSVTSESVGYVCGYIVKNMRRTDDHRLNGRWPEFARMSLKPGIGFDALWEVADVIMKYGLDERMEDVPLGARVGSQVKPYGRYLRTKLRTLIGRDDIEAVFEDEEMLALWNAAKVAAPKGGEVRRTIFRNMLIEAGEQRVLQMATRMKLFKSEKMI